MNQQFVDIVRSSGGNNAKRHLLLAGYCTDITLTVDNAFVVPKDDRVMVSVHYYTPGGFCILEEDADWSKAYPTWGTDSEVKELNDNFKKFKTRFVDNGIPVVIGEYGTPIKNKEPESIRKFLRTTAETALSMGAVPVVWDAGQYLDRNALTFKDPKIGELYKDIYNKMVKGNISGGSDNSSATNDEKCWSEPDYPCCTKTCNVIYTDSQEWGVEDGNWCGIPSSCKSLATALDSCPHTPDYPCCPTCDIFLTEEDGSRWGVLNDYWCSIKNSC